MVFTDPLVEPVEKVRTVLIAEQQIKLIGKDPGSLSFLPVLDHPVEDAVQGDQHPQGHELLSQFPDIIGNNAILRIYIGFLSEGVQASVNEQLRRQGKPPGFLFRLEHELSVQIFQGRHFAFITASDIFPVHICGTAVQDGLFLGRQVASPHQLFKQGQDKLRLLDQRILVISIGGVHIQRVQMGMGRCRNGDYFPIQCFHQRTEFRLRI